MIPRDSFRRARRTDVFRHRHHATATLEPLPGPEEFAMSKVHPVPSAFAAAEQIKPDDYQRLYAESLRDPEAFWANAAKRLDWMKPPTQIKDVSFDPGNLHNRWYADGVLNPTVSCLARPLDKRGDKTAILFEGDDPNVSRAISYRELHAEVCK